MASYNTPLSPAAELLVDTPDVWPNGNEDLNNSMWPKKSLEHPTSTLLYCLAKEAEDILELKSILDDH